LDLRYHGLEYYLKSKPKVKEEMKSIQNSNLVVRKTATLAEKYVVGYSNEGQLFRVQEAERIKGQD